MYSMVFQIMRKKGQNLEKEICLSLDLIFSCLPNEKFHTQKIMNTKRKVEFLSADYDERNCGTSNKERFKGSCNHSLSLRETGRRWGRHALAAFREPRISRLGPSTPALLRTGWVTRTNIEHSHFLRYDCWGEVSTKLTVGSTLFSSTSNTHRQKRISSPQGTSVERALSSFAVQWRPGRSQRAQGMVQDPGFHLPPHPDSVLPYALQYDLGKDHNRKGNLKGESTF